MLKCILTAVGCLDFTCILNVFNIFHILFSPLKRRGSTAFICGIVYNGDLHHHSTSENLDVMSISSWLSHFQYLLLQLGRASDVSYCMCVNIMVVIEVDTLACVSATTF